jgi:hypothetical protein
LRSFEELGSGAKTTRALDFEEFAGSHVVDVAIDRYGLRDEWVVADAVYVI